LALGLLPGTSLDGQVRLSWTEPTSNGGRAIAAYTVTATDLTDSSGSKSVAFTASSNGSVLTAGTVTGLTNGHRYRFTVKASNAAGDGDESAAITVAPAGKPAAPTGVVATRGDRSASVAFNAPASGGLPITGYTVTDANSNRKIEGTSSPIVVGNLINGQSYRFTVSATSTAGTSDESAVSDPVVPAGEPGAPTLVGATRGDGSATVSWQPPVTNGGLPVSSYMVVANPAVATPAACMAPALTGSSRNCVFTGLANGQSYTFTVIATTAFGQSAASEPSSAVVPNGVPLAPTGVAAVAGVGSATVTFTPPVSRGTAITSYSVVARNLSDGYDASTTFGSGSPITVDSLVNGKRYSFTVRGTNSAGQGSGATSSEVVIGSLPGAPASVVATAAAGGGANISVTAPTVV